MTTSERKKPRHKYRLQFHPAALKEWRKLDGSVKQPLKKLLEKRLDNPHMPGGELTGDLRGCYKIKLKKQGARLVYRVQDDALIVMVLAVDRREEGVVYRSAITRFADTIASLAKAAKAVLPKPRTTPARQ